MAKPFFLTGANAKVKINNKTMAFCQDLSYSVTIKTVNPKILGMYEGHSVEPLGYEVTGSFSVIRYMQGMTNRVGDAQPNGVSDTGNSIGNWGDQSFISRVGVGNDGRPNEQVNPGDLATSGMFDIEVYQKVNNFGDSIGVARIRGCRIERMDFSLSKNSPALERFTFRATYLDEDAFNADFSGSGFHF